MPVQEQTAILTAVQRWLRTCVVGLNLCPYARVPVTANQVRLAVTFETAAQGIVEALDSEIVLLANTESTQIETTLLILPCGFEDFLDFNDFLDIAEQVLALADSQNRFQLVSFHPHYRFAGVDINDAGNYTNRAPFPVLQLLREDTVARAVSSGDTHAIPARNIERLRSLPKDELHRLFSWVA